MIRLPSQFILLFAAVCVTTLSTAAAQTAEAPVVRAVLSYSPNWPNCHQVVNELLLPMINEYGDQLQIVGIDTSQMAGSELYQAAIDRQQVPNERRGVPTLVVHDVVLVGSREIPDQFLALVEEGLAAGGIHWPDIAGLAQLLPETRSEPSPTSLSPTAASPVSTSTVIPQATTTLAPSPVATPAPAVLAVGEDEIPPTEAQDPPPDRAGSTLAGVGWQAR